MTALDLYILISPTVALLLALLVFTGITPRKMRAWIVVVVRFVRFHPQTIVVLVLLLVANLVIITMHSVGYSKVLGIVSSILAILILVFSLTRYSGKRVSSLHTNLLAVPAHKVHSISQLPSQSRIVTPPYGPWLEWMHIALATHQKSFAPIMVPSRERVEALERGVVDAILLWEHPSIEIAESIASGKVCLLPWSKEAVERVVKSFPTALRSSTLLPNTYPGQTAEIQGYAPF